MNKSSISILPIILIIFFYSHQIPAQIADLGSADVDQPLPYTHKEVQGWAKELGKQLYDVAKKATQVDELLKSYKSNNAIVEEFFPEVTLDRMVDRLSSYLDKRRTLAAKLKQDLEFGDTTYEHPDPETFEDWNCFSGSLEERFDCIEKITQKNYRFVDARTDDVFTRDAESTTMAPMENETTKYTINGLPNPNFYNLSVDMYKSAVHVPTPIYKLNPELLEEIYWSEQILDKIFTGRRNDFPAASWQFYCSRLGFMRFYPAAVWNMDSGIDKPIDLYDCRNSEWFIDAATNAKNVLILLDMSGSMFGQRFEIAKQTIETILETLSENDFFNIITYNIEADFLLPYFNRTLVQATLRNKRLMRDYLSNYAKPPENVANLARALELAFETLLNLNVSDNFTDVRPSDVEEDEESEEERTPEKLKELEELRELYMKLVTNKTEKLGCNSAIMLITDGATDYYTNVFNTYNLQKRIRFFSFLIGNDVTNFDEVRKMACTNRGYFVHISNLADVQEKVQNYIEVMSRPVAQRNQSRAIWTGAYFDKMFLETEMRSVVYYTPSGGVQTKVMRLPTVPPKGQRLVTTVAYPVIINSTFYGVVGASAPITELQQMAAVYMLGANAYSFLVDNNGYVMFHPQLRPWHQGKPKPNYNSMDIMELEVQEDNTILRKYLVDGKSSRNVPKQQREREVLFAMDGTDGMGPRRVYRQENVYYFREINDTLMTLGLAVPATSTHRIQPPFPLKNQFDYKQIDYKWFNGTNWRLHPDWHYCRPNDTDFLMTKEEVFAHYIKQMKDTGGLPEKCANYSFLINRLLFDAKVTCQMDSCWISQSKLDARKGVHLVFLATQTGLTRFVNMNLEDIMYEPNPQPISDGNGTITAYFKPTEDKEYNHFIKRHTKGIDENFYRRAMRFPDGEFLFDVDPTNMLYIKNDSETFAHLSENKSILISAFRSVYLDDNGAKAPIGVVGLEMLYASFAEIVYNVTNKKCDVDTSNSLAENSVRCYLLDEHGYIIYTSATNDSSLLRLYLGRFFGHAPGTFGVGGKKYTTTHIEESVPRDRAEALVFKKLVEQGFYENLTYIDFQAICSKKEIDDMKPEAPASAQRLLSPFYHLAKTLQWILRELGILLVELITWNTVSQVVVRKTEAYTATFRDSSEGVPCDKWTPFYLLAKEQQKERPKPSEELFKHIKFACAEDMRVESFCDISASAARIPKTNLVFVILHSGQASKCRTSACQKFVEQNYWPHFGVRPVVNASDKIFGQKAADAAKQEKLQIESRYRRSPSVCYPVEEDTTHQCSSAYRTTSLAVWFLFAPFIVNFVFSCFSNR